jgi:hypothetical protein
MARLWAALAGALLALLAVGAQAAPVAGDWHGEMRATPVVTLRIAIHLVAAPGGGWTGTMDSLDQGAMGITLTAIAAQADALAFDAPSVHGHFAGRWDVAAKAWTGQWTQGGRDMPLSFTAGPPAADAKVEGLNGAWDGALAIGAGMKLRLAFRIVTGPYGTSGTMDSIDQGARGIPLAHLARDGAHVGFDVPSVRGRFQGEMAADGATVTGTWSQGAGDIPLVLERRPAGAAEARLVRPQTPVKPYPYREEEVAFENAAAHVRLAGALTLPPGAGPFPAVVLIAGSGPQNRNEEVMGHKIFQVLADHLTRHGIAVLRYDKRGLGGSTGDFAKATSRDFADDAQAAVALLVTRPQIDPARIGLIGHSEGGLVAPMIAARDPRVAFIVMMAGPGVDGAAVLAEQQRLIGKAMGLSDAELAREATAQASLVGIVRSEKDPTLAAALLKAAADELAAGEGLPAATLETQAAAINSAWFREFFTYDPAPALRRLRIPVLALIGSKDLQVPPDQNLPALRVALADDPRAKVEELAGLNHLFQPAATGAPSEYATIETTIDPAALALITDWILGATR